MKKHYKLGFGSLSLVLLLCAFVWSYSFGDFCIGDVILQSIGISAWSNGYHGIHYTIVYSLVFIIPAYLIADKYPNDLFAKTVCFTSRILWILTLLFLLFCTFTVILE